MSGAQAPGCLAEAFRRSNRVIAVQPWLVPILGPGPAIWLSQLMYRMERDDTWTLVAPDHEWEAETGLVRHQVHRARQKVIDLGWITCEVRKVAGTPTCRITFQPEAFEAAYRAIHCGESDNPGSRDSARTTTTPDGSLEGESGDRAAEPLFEQPEPRVTLTDDETFEMFWAVYPRERGSKGAARKKWGPAVRKAKGAQVLIDAARAFAESRRDEDPQYTVRASRWLNECQWADDLPVRRRLRERQTGGPGAVIGRSGETKAEILTSEELLG